MTADRRLGVYVHFPYCTRRCPYCDFTVTVRPIEHERYAEAVVAELAVRAPAFADHDPALSVYFGGGTPGLWRPACVGAVVDAVAARLGVAAGAEITVECNPEDVVLDHLVGLRAAGVTRISLGTQAFDDARLRQLGRQHDAATNRRAAEAVHAAGFPELSLDLIYGVCDQPTEAALADVAAAAALGPTHLSAYQLTIEAGTPFGARAARGEVLTGGEDALAEVFEAVRSAAADAGYLPYEISNFARPGHEAVHNSLYWTQGDYLALGAGAHGFLKQSDGGGVRWENARPLARYLQGALAGTPAEQSREVLDAATVLEERVFTGLRLEAGLPVDATLEARYGQAARRLHARGLLVVTADRWRTTPQGRLLLNHVALTLLDDNGGA